MKLLFITHESSRTGAPMVLLHLLRWFKSNKPEVIIDVLALKRGDLEDEFRKGCNVYFAYDDLIKPKKVNLVYKILLKLKLIQVQDKKDLLLKELSENNYQLVYANTIVSVPFAYNLVSNNRGIKFIAHIHELNTVIKIVLPRFKSYIGLIDQFIAPSILVKTNLVNNWAIPKNKITVVYECAAVDTKFIKKYSENKAKIFTVGASGTVDWRKGCDVFLQLARYINSNYPNVKIKFVWVGRISNEERIIVDEDLRKLNLKEIVCFTGEVKDPSVYFNDFDVFVMPSREDPFPLVCIEVGLLGKPIISFKGATGTEEIIENTGGGFVVPYLNVEAMSEKILYYYSNKKNKKEHGEINKIEFARFLPETICPKIVAVLNSKL